MKKEIGIVIACYRKHLQLKQDYVACKLGTTTHAYANIERGRSDISSKKLIAVSKLFCLKPYKLIVLAEEIMDVGRIDWLNDVAKGMIRQSKEKPHRRIDSNM